MLRLLIFIGESIPPLSSTYFYIYFFFVFIYLYKRIKTSIFILNNVIYITWIQPVASILLNWQDRYFPQAGSIVLVTVNYRLGALAFLETEWAQGNLGLRDQIMALEWVQDNIPYFGGDASQVTIFGQSAGICLIVFPHLIDEIK